jgi:hypothetical protein
LTCDLLFVLYQKAIFDLVNFQKNSVSLVPAIFTNKVSSIFFLSSTYLNFGKIREHDRNLIDVDPLLLEMVEVDFVEVGCHGAREA